MEEALSLLSVIHAANDLTGESKDATDRAHKELKLFKNTLEFVNNFDPTGVACNVF